MDDGGCRPGGRDGYKVSYDFSRRIGSAGVDRHGSPVAPEANPARFEGNPVTADCSSPARQTQDQPDLLWITLTQRAKGSPGATKAAAEAGKRFAGSDLAHHFAPHCRIRMLDKGMLKELQLAVASAGSSPARSATIRKPDVLVFEYDYPDMSSLGVLRGVRERHPHIPIVMFTLYHSEALAIWALRNRVWDYFIKPLPDARVAAIIRPLLRWHRLRNGGIEPSHFLNNAYPDDIRIAAPVVPDFDVTLALNYVEQHCAGAISEQAVADLYGMNRFRFSREFKRAMGETFQECLVKYRMTRARALLENPGALVADVASMVGFSDPAYFARVFKKVWGVPPSALRDKALSGGSCR